ncbi:MAG: winged helix-turn-helix domain-containing protein [Candidatus Helarchaeota archaeon]
MKNEKYKWVKYANIISSKNKLKIIKILGEKPSTPTNIASELKVNISLVSRLLKSLMDEDIIACFNPEARKGKLFYLTELGKWIFKIL